MRRYCIQGATSVGSGGHALFELEAPSSGVIILLGFTLDVPKISTWEGSANERQTLIQIYKDTAAIGGSWNASTADGVEDGDSTYASARIGQAGIFVSGSLVWSSAKNGRALFTYEPAPKSRIIASPGETIRGYMNASTTSAIQVAVTFGVWG